MVDTIQIDPLSPQPPSFLSPSLQRMRGLLLIFKEIKHLGRRAIYPPGSEKAAVSAHFLTTDSAASYSALFFLTHIEEGGAGFVIEVFVWVLELYGGDFCTSEIVSHGWVKYLLSVHKAYVWFITKKRKMVTKEKLDLKFYEWNIIVL